MRKFLLFVLVLAGCGDARIDHAQEAVKRQLIDPTSPLFRDVEPCYFNPDVIEGEVNAKNRFGAYVGFEPFLYVDGELAMGYDDPDWSYLFAKCTKGMPKSETSSDEMTAEEIQSAVDTGFH